EPAANLSLDEPHGAIGWISLRERLSYGRADPIDRTVAVRADRPLGDGPEDTYLRSEIDGEAFHIARACSGIGPHELGRPGRRHVRRAAETITRPPGCDAFMAQAVADRGGIQVT